MPQNPTKKDDIPWWRMPVTTWMSLVALASLSVSCCVRPELIDVIGNGLVRTVDFRFWPWWFFLELSFVLAFSVRWFLIYAVCYDNEMSEKNWPEARSFVCLTGCAGVTMLVLSILDRLGPLRTTWRVLLHEFKPGSLSVDALFFLTVLFALIVVHLVLFGNWMYALRNRNFLRGR